MMRKTNTKTKKLSDSIKERVACGARAIMSQISRGSVVLQSGRVYTRKENNAIYLESCERLLKKLK